MSESVLTISWGMLVQELLFEDMSVVLPEFKTQNTLLVLSPMTVVMFQ